MPTAPPTLTPAPAVPNKANRATYDALAIGFDTYISANMIPELALANAATFTNATESLASSTNAAASAVSAVAAANFKGNWSALTGALNMPASVAHNGNFWALNTNLANVTTATPGVSASWTFLNVGAGGSSEPSSAVDITLTSASFKVQSVVMTALDKSVTLPSALTLPAGGELFVVRNAGTIAFAIRANGGKMLTQLDGGQTALLYLSNVSTAAGVWVVGHVDDPEMTQTLFQATATTINAVASTRVSVTKMSSIQAIAAWSVSTGMVACTLNLTGNAVSAGAVLAVSVAGSPNSVAVTSLSTTQALVATQGTSGFLSAYALNVSGTTLTAGALLTVNAVASSAMSISKVSGTQAVVAYVGTSSFAQACLLSVSGTTVTNGAVVNLNAASVAFVAVAALSATQAIAITRSAGSMEAYSLQLSGTTITNGTVNIVETATSVTVASIAALSATEAVIACTTPTSTIIRVVSVIAGNLTSAGIPSSVARDTSGGLVSALSKFSEKSVALLEMMTAYSSNTTRQTPRVGLINRTDSTFQFGPSVALKNSVIATNFADIVAMDETKILAVYLESSGFVQARVLEVAA